MLAGGCAKNTLTRVEDPPAPAVSESDSGSATAFPVSKPVAKPSIVAADKRLETIKFEYNSYVLTAGAKQSLKSNAAWLLRNPEVKVTIEGYCDERGSDEYNLALGERRALTTENYLAELGVASERLAIISYGEERPVQAGHEEMAWEQNRRVEFR